MVAKVSSTTGSLAPINPGFSCNADGAFNQIVLTNWLANAIPAGTEVKVAFSGVTNPADFVELSKATVTLGTLTAGNIDQGFFTFSGNLFTKSYITYFVARAEDLTSGKFPVRYTFELQPKGRIAQGAYIVINLPPGIKPSDNDAMQRSCREQKVI